MIEHFKSHFKTSKMKSLTIVSVILCLCVTYVTINGFDLFRNEVKGFHFHTYFFQNNPKSSGEAKRIRDGLQMQIERSYLYGCIISDFYSEPHGPHPFGNFITCCNATSMWRAVPWFMQNHGNLSVLLHPLTRMWYTDHTDRAMFLGTVVPLDFTRYELPNNATILRCLPEDWP